MKLEITFLRSKVGRRMFFLFVACALLPISALAIVTYLSVAGELRQQSDERLHELNKSTTMAILERLALMSAELRLLGAASVLSLPSPESGKALISLTRGFEGITLSTPLGATALHGAGPEPRSLSEAERVHLARGEPLLLLDPGPEEASLLLVRELRPASAALLWARIDPLFLWWGPNRIHNLPFLTELCVLGWRPRRELFCSAANEDSLSARGHSFEGSVIGSTEWRSGDGKWVVHHRATDLLDAYGLPGLVVVIGESAERVEQPLAEFKIFFLPIVLTTLWLVLLLTVRQIRERLVPLETLRAGTRAIARRDFSARIDIRSGDEFEELATSFNRMSERLGRQFHSLTGLTTIQHLLLSATDTEEIARAVLGGLDDVYPCRFAALAIVERDEPVTALTYRRRFDTPDGALESLRSEVPAGETERLCNESTLVLRPSERLPGFLRGIRDRDDRRMLLAPVAMDGDLLLVLGAELAETESLSEDELAPFIQLADQVALAITKSRLIHKLVALGEGTLKALARTVDASSKWTHGHSERVAELAVKIGREMRLPSAELERLQRAALLHDIGKIGVPTSVLDKPGKLTADEMQQIRRHVEIGVSILEPVPSLADIVPIVHQHHECLDGSGYPRGLRGSEIGLPARILTVADVWDALHSARPYRSAVPEEEIVAHLRSNSGTRFDPRVVEALLRAFRAERDPAGEEVEGRRSATG